MTNAGAAYDQRIQGRPYGFCEVFIAVEVVDFVCKRFWFLYCLGTEAGATTSRMEPRPIDEHTTIQD